MAHCEQIRPGVFSNRADTPCVQHPELCPYTGINKGDTQIFTKQKELIHVKRTPGIIYWRIGQSSTALSNVK